MRHHLGLLLGFVCPLLASATARAELHRVEWAPSVEIRGQSGSGDPVLVLERSMSLPGHAWPVRVVRLEIAGDERVVDVRIEPLSETPLPAGATVVDALGTVEVDPGSPRGEVGGYAAWILPEGDFRGHRIAHILVMPIRKTDDGLRFLSEFTLDVHTAPAQTSALARRQLHERTEAEDARLLRAILDGEPRPSGATERTTPPELAPQPVEYLIVTNQEMAGAYQELAGYKTRAGQPAVVTTVEWILANYAGGDLPARIRAYIRDVYLYQGLRYVLLGGDADQVPTRIAVVRFQYPEGKDIATDLYFACVDGDWNADGDDEMGEAPDPGSSFPGDNVDLYPDVTVTRVPTATSEQVTEFMDKWKSYTGYDGANFRTDYQARALALGEVLFPANWEYGDDPGLILLDGADICESTLTYVPLTWSKTRLYEYYDNPEHPADPEIKDTVVVRINEGYGIIDHVGHGFRNNMSVGDGKLVNADADAFSNTNAYSFLYAANCASGAILFDSILERLIRNPSGGIIAGVASSDLDFVAASQRFKYEFYRLLFPAGVTTLGDAFHQANLPFTPVAAAFENSFRWTIFALVAVGDPSLDIWTDTPKTFSVSHAPTMVLGAGSYAVTVTDGGSPVADAQVALWKSDGYGVGSTNASGVATVPFLPATVGAFQITVTKHGYVPATPSATVVAPATAALRVAGWTLHDGTGGGTGNSDGRPDVGETIAVDLSLRNNGSISATGVQAVLHAANPYLTVTDSTVTGSSIPAGQTALLPGAFQFSVTTALPDTLRHAVVDAAVEMITAQGSWTEDWPFSVYQRILDLVDLQWAIPDDDGDGILESGETAEIEITLENRGEADARSVVAVGNYTGGDFVVLDDTINFGTIAAGAQMQGGVIRLLSVGGGAADVAVDLTVSDLHTSTMLERLIDIVAPAAPESLTYEPSPSSIRVVWARPTEADLRGYRIYRSSSAGGPYAPISPDIVQEGSFFADEALPPLTTFWYRAAAVDSSGNLGAMSDSIAASTSPPHLTGWPVPLPPGQESKGSPTFADVDWDGDYEVALGWSYPMVFRADGSDFVDGDGNAQTPGVFSDIGDGESMFWASPPVANLDQSGVPEIIFCAWNTTPTAPAYLYVFDATGAIKPGWPKVVGRGPWSTPAVGNVDNDPQYEIFVSSGANSGPYQGVLHGFNHNGTEIRDGDGDPSTIGVFYRSSSPDAWYMYTSPALGNFDGDAQDEIVFFEKTHHVEPTSGRLLVFNGDGTFVPGFPYGEGTLKGSTSSPAIADLDGNGDLEIVAVTQDRVVVVNHDGTNFSGWPKTLPLLPSTSQDLYDFMTSPAIGDVNSDGVLDIALGWLNGTVYVWNGIAGASHSGFPVQLPIAGAEFDKYLRSPILGNVDADPRPEIILSAANGRLYAVRYNGAPVSGFPLKLSGILWGSAAICDLDQDGNVNLIVQTDSPTLDVFDFPSIPYNPAQHPWPMFRHNQWKTGRYSAPVVVGVGDDEPVSPPAAANVFAPRPNPFTPRVSLPFAVPASGARVRIRVFDISGREVRTLADGDFPAGVFEINWDGRTSEGHHLAGGTYFARIEIGSEAFVQKLTMLR